MRYSCEEIPQSVIEALLDWDAAVADYDRVRFEDRSDPDYEEKRKIARSKAKNYRLRLEDACDDWVDRHICEFYPLVTKS